MFMRVLGSLISPTALGELIEQDWDLAAPATCNLAHHNVNDHYLVTDAWGEYMARLYGAARGTANEMAFELALAHHAGALGVGVSSPISRPDGSLWRSVPAPEGPRVLTLWTVAAGRDVSFDDAFAYGRQAASLHAAGDSLVHPPSRRWFDSEYLVRSRLHAIEGMPGVDDGFTRYAERVASELDKVAGGRPLDWGPCHGDLHGGNAHIDGEDLVLFDMDSARPGPRVYDVATFRWSLAWNDAEDGSHWEDFMDGYRSVRPAPDLDLVPLFVAARCVWLLGHWAGVENLEPNSVLMPQAWVSRLVGLCHRFTEAN